MSASRIKDLLGKSVSSSSLANAGKYTRPRSWGVYRIDAQSAAATKRYRFGNHPVRQHELEREFGVARLVALFTSRAVAEEFATLHNSARTDC